MMPVKIISSTKISLGKWPRTLRMLFAPYSNAGDFYPADNKIVSGES